MKKFLSALAILMVSQVSMANSLQNIRLQFQDAPKPSIAGGITKTLTVNASGLVIYRTTQAIYPNGIKSKVVANLSAFQMDRIERLIDRARGGRTESLPNTIFCFVASPNTVNYTADNQFVFLRSGTPCDGIFVNRTPAAKRLVNITNQLLSLAGNRENGDTSEVELDLN